MKKINTKYLEKSLSESYNGDVEKLEDIGKFVDMILQKFKESNITPISKVLIEIDEVFDGDKPPYTLGFNIKIINVDENNTIQN